MSLSILAIGCKSSKKGNKGKGKTTQTSNKPKNLFKFESSGTLSSLLDKSISQNKPVFVDFYTTWCMPCKLMDDDVFTDKALASFYNSKFINYKVDCEKGNGVNLATIFGVSTYPTLVYLDKKGNVMVRHEGAAYHTKMQELADEALTEFNLRD